MLLAERMSDAAICKGDLVVCANGHTVAKVVRDVRSGEMVGTWDAAIEWLQDDKPTVASTYKPKCAQCGADIFEDGYGWRMRIMGWRPQEWL